MCSQDGRGEEGVIADLTLYEKFIRTSRLNQLHIGSGRNSPPGRASNGKLFLKRPACAEDLLYSLTHRHATCCAARAHLPARRFAANVCYADVELSYN